MATHQERNHGSDTGRNPSPDRHRFSQEQWNALIYRDKTRPHHNGDPIGHEPCISIANRIFNRTQVPHYGFLSHQVYSSELLAKLVFLLTKLFSLKMARPTISRNPRQTTNEIKERLEYRSDSVSPQRDIYECINLNLQFVASNQFVYEMLWQVVIGRAGDHPHDHASVDAVPAGVGVRQKRVLHRKIMFHDEIQEQRKTVFRIASGCKNMTYHFTLGILPGELDDFIRSVVKSHMKPPHLIFWDVAGAIMLAVSREKRLAGYMRMRIGLACTEMASIGSAPFTSEFKSGTRIPSALAAFSERWVRH